MLNIFKKWRWDVSGCFFPNPDDNNKHYTKGEAVIQKYLVNVVNLTRTLNEFFGKTEKEGKRGFSSN